METISEIRHRNLLELIRGAGGVGALSALVGVSAAQVSQLKNRNRYPKSGKPRQIGDRFARRLEEVCGKPIGWMDVRENDTPASSRRRTPAEAQPLSLTAGSIAPPDTDGAMTMRLTRSEDDSIGGGYAPASSSAPPAGYVRLPVLGEAAAGTGRLASDSAEIVPQIDVLESWIRTALRANPARLRVLTARGHSMPGVAEDGDVMFVEPCTTFETDGIYVLTVGELLRVKRLRLRLADRQISIESTDGSAPEMVPVSRLDDDIHIQGRVVGAWTLRRF